MQQLTHLDQSGQASMVDVSQKAITTRQATATALLHTTPQVIQLIELQLVKKGDVLATARLAGIMATKQTSQLIPLCHPLPLSQVQVHFQLDQSKGQIRIQCCCKVTANTGVEMEAMTGVCIAALTLYDMVKAVDPALQISAVQLLEKQGGKSGVWLAPNVQKETADA
ncbi:MAG: cyclic pyranopterin monophosphate synthase MoaC [Gammaproteobacteria bacterium]|nr:cyclic pyranopterin monophosphate synthase MoaC [Gammaproteobacteria bacterium]